MKTRKCQWCGSEFQTAHHSKLYCSTGCKNDFGNWMTVVGKRIAPTAMAWRSLRGGAGTGSSALKQLCALLDEATAEFRAVRPKGAPSIGECWLATRKAPGVRCGMDR